ncbi:hypothetical protein [Bacillus cereus]
MRSNDASTRGNGSASARAGSITPTGTPIRFWWRGWLSSKNIVVIDDDISQSELF